MQRIILLSSGLVSGLGVDTFYLRLDLDGRKPVTFFLRPDEILGVQKVLSTALWAESILKKGEGA